MGRPWGVLEWLRGNLLELASLDERVDHDGMRGCCRGHSGGAHLLQAAYCCNGITALRMARTHLSGTLASRLAKAQHVRFGSGLVRHAH